MSCLTCLHVRYNWSSPNNQTLNTYHFVHIWSTISWVNHPVSPFGRTIRIQISHVDRILQTKGFDFVYSGLGIHHEIRDTGIRVAIGLRTVPFQPTAFQVAVKILTWAPLESNCVLRSFVVAESRLSGDSFPLRLDLR